MPAYSYILRLRIDGSGLIYQSEDAALVYFIR